jgi:hypothetical protein
MSSFLRTVEGNIAKQQASSVCLSWLFTIVSFVDLFPHLANAPMIRILAGQLLSKLEAS